METMEEVRSLLEELFVPEFKQVKAGLAEVFQRSDHIDRQLEDINTNLVEWGRGFDERMLGSAGRRSYEGIARGDAADGCLVGANPRIDACNERIGSVNDRLTGMIGNVTERLDRMSDAMVRRENHRRLERMVEDLRERVSLLEKSCPNLE